MENVKLTDILQNLYKRRILFYFSIFNEYANAYFYLKLDKKELVKELMEFERLNLVKIDNKKVQLAKLGCDAIKLDIIFLSTFFELLDGFLNDLNLKEYLIQKSKLPCVYYDALSRAMKPFLYFIHLYNINETRTTCNLNERNLKSVVKHFKQGCETCKLSLIALKHDEVIKPVVERLLDYQ
ncbi:hypothetical protein DRO97_00670 [Archaeoglobales archaeon]|nr:MAG: hypothetical protein DRO97_00670 [Archaeoglobales archaeon]